MEIRKKAFVFTLVTALLLLLFTVSASATVIEGECALPGAWGGGGTLSYYLNTEVGELIISGTGGWADYSSDTPWGWIMNPPSFGSGADYREYVKKITIGNGITEIAANAFAGCRNAASVTIPSSVTRIGNNAFKGCSSLKTVTIPGNVKTIEAYAFTGCTSLTAITIPSSVTSIGTDAFSDCTSLGAVTAYGSLGDKAFRKCGATSITVENCSAIGDAVFQECDRLTSVKISGTATSLGVEAFDECTALQTVTLPDTITEIKKYAFYDCNLLGDIKLPASLVRLGQGAFKNSGVKSVVMSDLVTDLGEEVFCACKSMTSIQFSNGIREFPYRTVYDCYELREISLPSQLEKIGQDCFGYCKSLVSIELPSTVTSIGPWAFLHMGSLKSLKLYGNLDHDAVNSNDALETVSMYNCGSIGTSAIRNNGQLKIIRIEGTVSVIPESALAYNDNLIAVGLPATVKTITEYAFRSDKSLKAIYTPLNREDITVSETGNGYADSAIWHCGETIPAQDGNVDLWTCSYTWSVDNATVSAVAVCGNRAEHQVTDSAETRSEITEEPGCETVGKRKFTTREFHFHMFETQEKTVDEPALGHDWRNPDYSWADDYSTVTAKHICRRDSNHEETETVKTTYAVQTEPTYTDAGVGVYTATFTKEGFTTQTREVRIDPLPPEMSAGGLKYALNLSASTATVTGPVKKDITKSTIPATVKDPFGKSYQVTAIESLAFSKCTKLTKLSIGKNVKTIGKKAFFGCTALNTLSGGQTLVTIGESAFQNCKALQKLTLNSRVKDIGKKAFYGCKKLKTIILKTKLLTEKTVGANAFKGIATKPTVTCPKGKRDAYKKLLLKRGMPKGTVFK